VCVFSRVHTLSHTHALISLSHALKLICGGKTTVSSFTCVCERECVFSCICACVRERVYLCVHRRVRAGLFRYVYGYVYMKLCISSQELTI